MMPHEDRALVRAPYRDELRSIEPPSTPPHELFYRPYGKNLSSKRSYWHFLVLLAAALLAYVHPVFFVVLAVLFLAVHVYLARRASAAGIRISIADNRLTIEPAGGVLRVVRMSKLRDVVLDTRTARRAGRVVQMDGILASGPTFQVDESRIVFVVDNVDPVYLTDAYFSQADTAEWLGRIRVFLRARGWVPFDERESVEGEPR